MTSTLKANTIEPAGSSLTLGASGDTVVIGNNDIRANTYKDAGGNTLFTSNGSGVLSSVSSGLGDGMRLLSTTAVPSFITGDRSADTTVFCNFEWAFTSSGDTSGNGLVNGIIEGNDESDNGWFPNTGAVAGRTIAFDFGTGKVYKACQWVTRSSNNNEGTWKWQGSNNASSWTDIGGTFLLGDSSGSSPTYFTLGDTLNSNTTSYRYYRILGISGNGNTSGRRMAMRFSETAANGNTSAITYTSGIDATYKEYVWKFISLQPSAASASLRVQVNASDDTGGGFDTTPITSSSWYVSYGEGNVEGPTYTTSYDRHQETTGQDLMENAGGIGSDPHESVSGEFRLYNPASTTYVKNFTAKIQTHRSDNKAHTHYTSGYFNTALAIPEIKFWLQSGNFNTGKVKLYGVAD